MLRNWTSHHLFQNSKIDECFVAYLTICNFRAIFQTDLTRILPYEQMLLDLFKSSNIADYRQNVAKSYYAAITLPNVYKKGNNFWDVIDDFSKNNDKEKAIIQQNSVKLFYQALFNFIFEAQSSAYDPERAKKDEQKESVAIFVNFKSSTITNKEFVKKICQAVYLCFARTKYNIMQ